MIVVGGKQSANTRRLADTAGRLTETHLAENAAEVDPAWLTGHRHIGVVAGTSTPEETVQQVAHRLREITGT
jgi:4-hydroxy-3-methylbut-2-enyl diphosphate reductase